jgi:imidazolonepropionase-like amidohydrolase
MKRQPAGSKFKVQSSKFTATRRPFILHFALCIFQFALVSAVSAQTLTIKNARIYTVSGTVIERGNVVVENGRIKAVGPNVTAPAGSRVIDGTGKVVMPGIVDANARFGIPGDENEQSLEVTPEVRAVRLFDPYSSEARRALQAGVTSACLNPGSANSVGGLCAVVKLGGAGKPVRDGVAMKAALGQDVSARNGGFRTAGDGLASMYTRRPNSRMGAMWELRHALFQGEASPSLSRVLKNELPLRVHARIENDIRAAMTVAEEFGLKRIIIDDGIEAYKVADILAARGYPVVLGPYTDPQGELAEGSEGALNTAGILAGKGVKVAFGSNGGDATRLLTWAALAVRAGLSKDAAIRALTLSAAQIAGVADRVGSIQAGRDADLLIFNGEPLDVTSRIETVVVNGRVVHEEK